MLSKSKTVYKGCICYNTQSGDSDLKQVAKILEGKESYISLIKKVKEITTQFRDKREILVALAPFYPYKKVELLNLAEN